MQNFAKMVIHKIGFRFNLTERQADAVIQGYLHVGKYREKKI